MAISYQAKIDLIVGGLREIKEAEQRIKKLVNESKKLKRGSVAQRGTVALASVTRTERQASRRSVQTAERRVLLASKLNSATDLYNRKLQQITRNGAANNKSLQGRIDQIKQAFEVGTKGGQRNLSLVRALATELGRVVEKQNELNRAQSLKSKGFEAGRRGFERIAALESAGFGDVKGLSRAKTLVRGIGAAAATGDQEAYNEALRKAKAVIDRLERQYKEGEKAQRDANKAKRDLAKAERDVANQQKARRSARNRKLTDVATGFGFPLLFGGGPLQAVAGGVGGAFGGLGGSIATSAVVAQFEAFGQAAAQTGQALNSTGGALDLMREKSLFSSKAVEEQAAVLEEQGRVAELSALLTGELVDKIGNNGVKALQNLGTETDETTRLWNELTLQLQALISGPLQGFLNLVNNFLGGVVARGRLNELSKDLEGTTAGKRLKSEIKANTPQAGFFEEFILGSGQGEIPEEAAQKLFEKYKGFRKTTANIPITAEDRRRFATKARGKGTDRAARDEERLQQRLAKLRLERDQIAEITKFKDRIAAAEAASDQLTAARIKGEQRIFEIEQQRLNKLIGVKDQREIDEINITNAAKKVAAMLDTEREMAEIQRQKTELFENTVENLELQLAIATATTREEAEQLRIQQEMKGLEGKGFSNEQLERIKSLKEGLNQAQQPLNKFIIDSTRALNDLEQVAVNVSQGIGNAIGNSLNNGISSLIEGSGSVKEVFADMLKSIGQVLVQEGTKMIAMYIAIGIAKAFAGMGGGGYGSGAEKPLTSGMDFSSAFSGGGFGIAPRANGGPVNRNSAYIVGENGPELFRPTQAGRIDSNSDMRSMMSRQRNTAPAMNFTFETTNIGGQEFVSREQLEAAMAVTRRQAASDGAQRGMNMTLDKMQQSPATRRRVGIS